MIYLRHDLPRTSTGPSTSLQQSEKRAMIYTFRTLLALVLTLALCSAASLWPQPVFSQVGGEYIPVSQVIAVCSAMHCIMLRLWKWQHVGHTCALWVLCI